MRNLYVATGILAAGLTGRYAYSPGSPPANSKTGLAADASSASAGQASVEGPLKILCNSRTSQAEDCDLNVPFEAGLRVAIAIVPDPEKTSLRLWFDRNLEAIERAAQDSGYVFYDYWLPWSTSTGSAYSRLKDRKQAKEEREQRRQLPGVLAFRAGGGAGRGLVVFLIGESPTGWINQDQLNKALLYQRRLARDQLDVRIIGPCFSGSLDTLRLAIHDQPKFRSFYVLSGTATSEAAGLAFQKYFEPLDHHSWNVRYLSARHSSSFRSRC